MVEETNRYAATVCGTTPKARKWIDTDVVELKAFVGMLLAMGVVTQPRIELFWSLEYPETRTPGISEIMTLGRFEQLFRCFHFCDNAVQIQRGQPGHDKLNKIRPLMDILLPRFVSECDIHKECSIDEAMIPFKGRLGFKQYMKDKPTKWGIKVFVLGDAHNGYVKTLQVYTGKGLEANSSDIGLCTKVCLDLMDGVDGEGLELYTDNYYTSPTLYQHLYEKYSVNACGTCRPSRVGFPTDELYVKATKYNRGTVDYLSKGPLLACSWVDKRSIYLITTIHVGEQESGDPVTVKRKEPDGSTVDRNCPPCLPDYQAYMRGVDRGDQSRCYYSVGRRSQKWWRRVWWSAAY